MNSLFTINPYWTGTVLAFDDAKRGLLAEPFVGDINRMIDQLCERVGSRNVSLLFSHQKFPGYQIELMQAHDLDGGTGTWYRCHSLKLTGWLCPALFKYFPNAPEQIYVQAIENKLSTTAP